MVRPCFLVIDREFAGSLSTRKLVIETAKFNVITAYSSQEAIETLQRYPAVDGIVIDTGLKDMPCSELVTTLRQIQPNTPIVAIGAPLDTHCAAVDQYLESFNPPKLLEYLRGITPRRAEAIRTHEEDLARTQ